jgi:hypothetical protein
VSATALDALLAEPVLERLRTLGSSRAEEYAAGNPFPHIVLDDFLPEEPLLSALAAFPEPRQLRWIGYDDVHERKLAYPVAERLPPPLRDILFMLNCSAVLQFLEALTGIQGLVPDPHFTGGGLHQIERGGFLGVHADFNRLDRLGLERRLNLLLYLNRDWRDEYGGHLELWDRGMTRCVKRVLPVFNRCVVFSTTDFAFHGHPTPLTCPEGWTRKSLATYYYSNGRPASEVSDSHSTLFQQRPGVAAPARSALRRIKMATLMLVPPIVLAGYERLRRRSSR